MKKNILFFFSLLFLLFSCATKSNDLRVFFVGQGKLQYFFPSHHWAGKSDKASIDADFLFRSYMLDGESESKTIFNFTLTSEDIRFLHQTPILSIALAEEEGKPIVYFNEIEPLFAEKSAIRYTSWTLSKNFSAYILSSQNPTIQIETKEGIFTFYPNTEFKKHIEYFKAVNPQYDE